MVARLEKTPRSVMFSGHDWILRKPAERNGFPLERVTVKSVFLEERWKGNVHKNLQQRNQNGPFVAFFIHREVAAPL